MYISETTEIPILFIKLTIQQGLPLPMIEFHIHNNGFASGGGGGGGNFCLFLFSSASPYVTLSHLIYKHWFRTETSFRDRL